MAEFLTHGHEQAAIEGAPPALITSAVPTAFI